jgi:hypothetical protein
MWQWTYAGAIEICMNSYADSVRMLETPAWYATDDNVWRIYSYFSLPGSITLGQKVTSIVLDLSTIKLVGGNEGLARCWDTWSHCVKRIVDNPPRTTCGHLFVDEMRQAPVMLKYVREYDDLAEGHIDETWGWVEKKGRACFERARQHDNRTQSQYGLSGRTSRQAIVDVALLGEQYVPPVGKGQGQAQSSDGNWQTVPLQKGQGPPQSYNGNWPTVQAQVPNGNWPVVPQHEGKGETRMPISKEHKVANGPCWFFAAGACVRKSCNKDHRVMTPEEIAAIPKEWYNRNLPGNKGRGEKFTPSGGEDGWQTDLGATGTDDEGQSPKRWTRSTTKGKGKPGGEGSRPCRSVENNGTCPRGVDCYSLWSRPGGVDVSKLAKSVSSGASASDGGAVAWTGV